MKKFLTLSLMILSGYLYAQKIPFQGRLLEGGKPFNGTSTIEFNIASPVWSETKSNVNVQDGYYSVVLGETTPLPDTLFLSTSEVQLDITVNGEILSPATLYSSLLPYTGPQGLEVDTLRTFMAEATGVDDEGKARIATTNGGYDGVMSLTDSLGRTGNFIRTRKSGGYIQLAQQDFTDDSFKSAALLSTFGNQGSYMDLYGGNAANDGIQLLVDAYASDITPDGPTEDGYRRGGLDIFNYFGSPTHNIFSTHQETSTTSYMNLVASQDDGEQTYSMIISSGDGINSGGSINITDQSGLESISLDGTTGTINAQQILIDGSPIGESNGGTIEPDSVKSKSIRVISPDGSLKADLNFFEPNDAGSLVLNGANDSTKVILGSASGGYSGFLGLYDSLRNQGVRLDARNDGGFLRLSNINNEGTIFESAITAQSFGDDSFLSLSGKNASQDGTITLLSLYGHNDLGSPEYRRGGINISNYYGAFTHDFFSIEEENISKSAIGLSTSANGSQSSQTVFLYSGDSIKGANGEFRGKGISRAAFGVSQNSDGADIDGTSGYLDIFGDESVNVQLASSSSEDHDLGIINVYGSIDDGGSWWYNTAELNTAKTSGGTEEFGNVNLYNNSTGNNNPSTWLTGNLFESGGGGLILRDDAVSDRIILNGSDGTIGLSDDAGVSRITAETEIGRFNTFGPSGSSNVTLRGRGNGDFGFVEMFNSVNEVRAEIGSFSDNSGFMLLYGDNGNKNIQIDRNPANIDLGQISVFGTDGISARIFATADTDGSNEWGFMNIDGPSGGIQLDGNSGNITAVSLTQTSDLRLKKNITNLSNPLSNVLKMRGVSYTWKDENRSNRNQIGVIAQEVEGIYPEFVHTDSKGMKSVNYAQMSAVLIEAIKELNAKVETLESENDSLKASLSEVEILRADMDRLMKMIGTSKAASK